MQELEKLVEEFEDSLIAFSHVFHYFIPANMTNGLSLEQHKIIKLLANKGACQHSDLVEWLKIDKGLVSDKVHKLEKLGIVSREKMKSDKRKISISLTSAGEEVHASFQEVMKHAMTLILEEVKVDEIEHALGTLHAILTIIKKMC